LTAASSPASPKGAIGFGGIGRTGSMTLLPMLSSGGMELHSMRRNLGVSLDDGADGLGARTWSPSPHPYFDANDPDAAVAYAAAAAYAMAAEEKSRSRHVSSIRRRRCAKMSAAVELLQRVRPILLQYLTSISNFNDQRSVPQRARAQVPHFHGRHVSTSPLTREQGSRCEVTEFEVAEDSYNDANTQQQMGQEECKGAIARRNTIQAAERRRAVRRRARGRLRSRGEQDVARGGLRMRRCNDEHEKWNAMLLQKEFDAVACAYVCLWP
jgi:hypothetical protein